MEERIEDIEAHFDGAIGGAPHNPNNVLPEGIERDKLIRRIRWMQEYKQKLEAMTLQECVDFLDALEEEYLINERS